MPSLLKIVDASLSQRLHLLITFVPTAEIGKLTTLSFFIVSSNPSLSGTIPTEVGLLSSLVRFDVDRTSMVGSVPQELCDLRGGVLEKLKSDCLADSDGSIPISCPEGCCSKCCSRETQECHETIFNDAPSTYDGEIQNEIQQP